MTRGFWCGGALALAVLLCGVAPRAEAQPKGKGGVAARPAGPPAKIDVAAARADLLSPDVDRASAAANRLGDARQPGAVDALLDALALGLHPRVAAAALDALARQKAPASLDTLLHYARNRNPEVRARAVRALGALDDRRAVAAWRGGFTDGDKAVRAAAAQVAAERKDTGPATAMVALLKKGDEAMAPALAAIANADLARKVAELIGDAPDSLVAQCLGAMLVRKDLGPESLYVELVRAIGKVPGDDAVVALTAFISATPESPPRQSRREAQMIYEQRLGGGNK